jgi:hypothetical protein
VAHREFLGHTGMLVSKISSPGAFIDVKSVVDGKTIENRGITLWRL